MFAAVGWSCGLERLVLALGWSGLRVLACLGAPKYPVVPLVMYGVHVSESKIGLCTCALRLTCSM